MKFSLYLDGRKITPEIFLTRFSTESIGIFETMRLYNGRLFRREEHFNRLEESARTSGFSGLDLRSIRKQLNLAVKAFGQKEASVRLTLVGNEILIMMGERKPPEEIYKTGVKLRTSPVKRSLSHAASPEIKTTDYMNAVMATLEPSPKDIYEWVFLDRNGYLTEVRIGNLFIVARPNSGQNKTVLVTPPLQGILNGVTRRFVIECASLAGIPVLETSLTRHEVYNAREAFLTNTSWEILPVSELDGRLIGNQIPGPETEKLHKIFKQKVLLECPKS